MCLKCHPNEIPMTSWLWPLNLLEGDEDFSELLIAVLELSVGSGEKCILYEGRASDLIMQLCWICGFQAYLP